MFRSIHTAVSMMSRGETENEQAGAVSLSLSYATMYTSQSVAKCCIRRRGFPLALFVRRTRGSGKSPPPCSSRSLLASSLLCDDPCAPLSMQLAPWKGGSASKGRRRSRAASCRPRNAPFLLFVPIAWERVAVCNISLKRNLERKPINNNNESARSFDY